MNISVVKVRPYLMVDFAFSFSINFMKKNSDQEQRFNTVLKEWEGPTSCTQKPVACSFRTVKGNYGILIEVVRLLHENEISFLIRFSVVLHTKRILEGKKEE